MQFGFNTDDVTRAKAALILYAMYRSRGNESALNGLETWNRFSAYIRGAAIKSTTTAEFVQNFCKSAKVGSIKPIYLSCKDNFVMMGDGAIIQSDDIKNYRTDILQDNTLLQIYEREGIYLTMLVRERIQREKYTGIENQESED